MILQLKEGAYYLTQDGRRIGPATKSIGCPPYSWKVGDSWYMPNGSFWLDGCPDQADIVGEVPRTPKPPRKVAKRKVVVRWCFILQLHGDFEFHHSLTRRQARRNAAAMKAAWGKTCRVGPITRISLPSPAPARNRKAKP